MRIFVTGGTGFLGTRLVRRLLADGHDVRALVRKGHDHAQYRQSVGAEAAPGRLEIAAGSLAGAEAMAGLIGGCEAVVHAAAAMGGGAAVLFANNVVPMRDLVRAASLAGVGRFVHVSSLGVYGTDHLRAGDVLDETCPLDAVPHKRDPYSYSKIAQELIAWDAHARGLPLVVIRPGVIHGPGRGCMSNRIGLRVGPVIARMGGRQQLPYVHVDNCADGIALAATAPAAPGQAFNLLDDDLRRARDVLKAYRREVEKLRVLPIPYWAINPLSAAVEWYHHHSNGQLPAVLTRYKSMALWKRLRYSNDKAKSLLGWAPRVPFEEGLRQSLEWSRRHLESQRQAAGKAA